MSETPVIQHTSAADDWATSAERTLVFTVTREVENPAYGVQGDEGSQSEKIIERHEYTMPKAPNAGLALIYLKRARANADMAMSWLVETAIGSDGYDALAEEMTGLAPAEAMALLQSTVERIQKVAMGGLDGQGNAPKA